MQLFPLRMCMWGHGTNLVLDGKGFFQFGSVLMCTQSSVPGPDDCTGGWGQCVIYCTHAVEKSPLTTVRKSGLVYFFP